MISETDPIMNGLLVSGRVGVGIGAELGGMKVTEQIFTRWNPSLSTAKSRTICKMNCIRRLLYAVKGRDRSVSVGSGPLIELTWFNA